MLKKSKKLRLMGDSFVECSQMTTHPLKPKIAVGLHYMLIVSDRLASQSLLERPQCRRLKKRAPIVASIANFLTANWINPSRVAR